MKRKRGPFMTFILSCIPGAGQMYLGFFKEGVSLMLLFIGVLVLSSWLYVDVLGLLAIVVWFYAFFDAINKNSMPDEEFAALEDHYVLLDYLWVREENLQPYFLFCLEFICWEMMSWQLWHSVAFTFPMS